MEAALLLILLAVSAGTLFLAWSAHSKKDASKEMLGAIERLEARLERVIKEEVYQNRREMSGASQQAREEVGKSMDRFRAQLAELADRNEGRMQGIRELVEKRLEFLQKDNAEKLERMRLTVDEKLHETLEKRLDASFAKVQHQLESVHKGLGEMQSLATGVGDLKKVLQNVKTRGTWGETQLGNLLDDILTPEQYETNVATKKGSADRVEFAIKIPSKNHDGEHVLLPMDAKFPLEDYQILLDASERGDMAAVEQAGKQLEIRIKGEAKSIRDKYLDPPATTDFGMLFLPNEGLYAEVLRRAGLADALRREFRVVVAGPATIAAFLNSLQMGFRTLAIEKRSGEVWELLSVVKKEFSLFGTILEKTHKKLQEASNTIEKASSKSRNIERKLSRVQELPTGEKSDAPDPSLIPQGREE